MTEALPPIVLAIETPATPADAWAALTEPERIAEWFTDALPLGQVGDPYRLDFGDGSVVEGVVRLVEPGPAVRPYVGLGGRRAASGDRGHLVRRAADRRRSPGHPGP